MAGLDAFARERQKAAAQKFGDVGGVVEGERDDARQQVADHDAERRAGRNR